jgi:HEAT repeat protein
MTLSNLSATKIKNKKEGVKMKPGKIKKGMFTLITWIIWCLLIILAPFVSAQDESDPESGFLMASPGKLLELYESATRLDLQNAIGDALIAKREESLPVLRQILMTGTEKQKLLSLSLLIEMRDEQSGDILVETLKDDSLKVQRRTAYALGYLRHEKALEPLIVKLKNTEDIGLIKSILAGLGMLRNKEAIPFIRQYLNHADSSVRVNAAIALAWLGSEEAISEVIQASRNLDNQTSREGTFGLGFFQDQRAHERLQEILATSKTLWQTDAEISLLRRELFKSDLQERLGLLRKVLNHPNKRIRSWAIDEIVELGTPESIEELRSLSEKNTSEGKQARRILYARGLKK